MLKPNACYCSVPDTPAGLPRTVRFGLCGCMRWRPHCLHRFPKFSRRCMSCSRPLNVLHLSKFYQQIAFLRACCIYASGERGGCRTAHPHVLIRAAHRDKFFQYPSAHGKFTISLPSQPARTWPGSGSWRMRNSCDCNDKLLNACGKLFPCGKTALSFVFVSHKPIIPRQGLVVRQSNVQHILLKSSSAAATAETQTEASVTPRLHKFIVFRVLVLVLSRNSLAPTSQCFFCEVYQRPNAIATSNQRHHCANLHPTHACVKPRSGSLQAMAELSFPRVAAVPQANKQQPMPRHCVPLSSRGLALRLPAKVLSELAIRLGSSEARLHRHT